MTTLTPAGLGTKDHVELFIKALNSSTIACCQLGSLRAVLYVGGIGEIAGEVESTRKRRLGMQKPDLARVDMEWLFLVGAMGRARGGRRGRGVGGGSEVEEDLVGLAWEGTGPTGAEGEEDSLRMDGSLCVGADSEEDGVRGEPGVVRGPGEVEAGVRLAGEHVAVAYGVGESRRNVWGGGALSERIRWGPGGAGEGKSVSGSAGTGLVGEIRMRGFSVDVGVCDMHVEGVYGNTVSLKMTCRETITHREVRS